MNKIYLENQPILITNAAEDDNLLRIAGSAAHLNVPNLNNEIVTASSFDDFFVLYNESKLRPAFTYNHDPNMLIGGIDSLSIKDDTLYCEAHINKDIAFCRDTLVPMIMSGDCSSYSTEGFVSYNDIEEHEDGTYTAKRFLITAISAVTVPADYRSKFSIKNFYEAEKVLRQEEEKKKKLYILF